jgi:rhodanese-related sulfurtransferase
MNFTPRARWAAAPLLAVGLLLAGCSDSAEVTDVDAAAASEIVAAGESVVLDVRTPAEFAAGHLPGAVNIDVQSPDFADRVAGLDEGEATLVYCQTGNRSGVATDEMVDLGFTELSELSGGIEAWAAAGGQVVQG